MNAYGKLGYSKVSEMELNCLIVDDEPLALDLLEAYVQRTPFLRLCARCGSALEVLQLLDEHSIDLIFWISRCRN